MLSSSVKVCNKLLIEKSTTVAECSESLLLVDARSFLDDVTLRLPLSSTYVHQCINIYLLTYIIKAIPYDTYEYGYGFFNFSYPMFSKIIPYRTILMVAVLQNTIFFEFLNLIPFL